MSDCLRSFVAFAALLSCACVASAPGLGGPRESRQPSLTTDVVYGHKDGLALTFDVHHPAQPNAAGVIAIVSGGWQSSVEIKPKESALKADLVSQGQDTPPFVSIERFFDGNEDEGSIGCNLLDHPGLEAFREARLVGLARALSVCVVKVFRQRT